MLGIVLVVNTILALSESVVHWWSRESDPTSSSLPRVVQEILGNRPASTSDADLHLLMWFVAGVVACTVTRTWRSRMWLLLALFAYSAVLEAFQGLFANRGAEWIDLFGNALGLILAAAVTYVVGTYAWPRMRAAPRRGAAADR